MNGKLVVLGSVVTALAVVRAARRLGLQVVLIDSQRGPAVHTRLARVRVVSRSNSQAITDLLLSEAESRPSYLIAATDQWLRVIAKQRGALDSAFTRVLHPANDILTLCLSKLQFARWCCEQGLPSPRTYEGDGDNNFQGAPVIFPVFVRPDETLHSNALPGVPKAVEMASPGELQELLARFRRLGVTPVVSQSLLVKRLMQYSVGVARSAGHAVALTARKVRPPADFSSVGTLVEVVDQPQVESLARRALDLMGYEGLAEVEVLADEDTGEMYLIEVNARPWLQFSLAARAGLDMLRYTIAPETAPTGVSAKLGLRWVDFDSDLYLCFNRATGLVRSGRISWGEYLKSFSGVRSFARWSLLDPAPFLESTLQLLASRLWKVPGSESSGETPR